MVCILKEGQAGAQTLVVAVSAQPTDLWLNVQLAVSATGVQIDIQTEAVYPCLQTYGPNKAKPCCKLRNLASKIVSISLYCIASRHY